MVTSNRRRKKPVSPDSAPAALTTAPTPAAAPAQTAEAPAPKETEKPESPQTSQTEEAAPAVASKKGKKTEQTTAAETAASASGPEQDASLEHGRHVAFLADRLFDELAELHGLGKKWRRRLHLAALLHDIGFAEGRRKHHKISMRRIETDTTLGIADKVAEQLRDIRPELFTEAQEYDYPTLEQVILRSMLLSRAITNSSQAYAAQKAGRSSGLGGGTSFGGGGGFRGGGFGGGSR